MQSQVTTLYMRTMSSVDEMGWGMLTIRKMPPAKKAKAEVAMDAWP
jgi:hypothetical protein